MSQIRSGTSATAAVLAGSLSAFGLLDVLRLLCRTKHVGELQVVGDGVEAHLWVHGGELLERPATAAERLFELACLDDAWFTVTAAMPPGRGADDANRVALEPLIDHVAPQVAEWHALVQALPFAALARMAPAMPGAEVQIRADQWRILSLIGAGRPVHEVIDVSDARPLETLRLVHELAEEQLIAIEVAPADGATAAARRPGAARPAPARPARSAGPDAAPGGHAAAEPMRLIPVGAVPSAAGSWRRGGATTTATSPARPAHGAPAGAARPHGAADPPARVAAYMPPPLTPELWSRRDAATAEPEVAASGSEG